MSYRDSLTTIASDVAVPTSTTNTNIGNGVHLVATASTQQVASPGWDPGLGCPLYVNIIIGDGGEPSTVRGGTATAASFPTGNGSLTLAVRGSATDETPDTTDTIVAQVSLSLANIRNRTQDKVSIPLPAAGFRIKYIGLTAQRSVSGTGGTITAWVSHFPLGIQAHYPDANN